MVPLRVTIDSTVVEKLAFDPELAALMRDAVRSGRLVLVAPRLERRQLKRTPLAARERLVKFVADVTLQVRTAGLMLDLTRWGDPGPVTETQASELDSTPARRPHSADAVTLAVAQREGTSIVTDDKGFLHQACLDLGVEVMTTDELIALVRLM